MEALSYSPPSSSSANGPKLQDIEKATDDLMKQLEITFRVLKDVDNHRLRYLPTASVLERLNEIILGAWEDPNHSNDLGIFSCGFLRSHGVIDFLLNNAVSEDALLSAARLLKSCLLTEENREYVVAKGLKQAVLLAARVSKKCLQLEPHCCRAASGIIEYLYDHNEKVCMEVTDLGGLDILLNGCQKTDELVLQHCSRAIANLSVFGNPDIYATMMAKRVTLWLFPLAFYNDNLVKYYSLIAISALYDNGFKGPIDRGNFMDLIKKFVVARNPCEFVRSDQRFTAGHNASWLDRLIPLLSSEKAEIRMLSSFHFCMEACIKKAQRQEKLFNDITAIQPLAVLASKKEPIASRFASQALLVLRETEELSCPESNLLDES